MFRNIYGDYGTPIQQAMTVQPEYYSRMRMDTLMLGVVVDVMPADATDNESAQRSNVSRGFMPQCSVLVVSGGTGMSMFLDKVYILPDSLTGTNDFCEHLPRGSKRSLSTNGDPYNSSLLGINPMDLDGEWCIVGFLGGNVDQPFILKWWPHPRNSFDPLTSGNGNPDGTGTPKALNQLGRMFKRINGVEHVITRNGDVYLSTYFAGSEIAPELPHRFGRYGRHLRPNDGGSIKVNIKPTQQLEINFNEYEDGLGIDRYDESLPQQNPKETGYSTLSGNNNTKVLADQISLAVYTPNSLDLMSDDTARLSGTKDVVLYSGDTMSTSVAGNNTTIVDGTNINLTKKKVIHQSLEQVDVVAGYPSSTADALGPMNIIATGEMTIRSGIVVDPGNPPTTPAQPANMNVQATGNMSITVGNAQDGNIPPADLNLAGTGKAVIDLVDMLNLKGSEVNVGSTSTLPADNAVLLKQFANDATFSAKYTTLQGIPAAATPSEAITLVNALNDAFKALVSSLKSTATTVTKAT